jgi:hypothetical protein
MLVAEAVVKRRWFALFIAFGSLGCAGWRPPEQTSEMASPRCRPLSTPPPAPAPAKTAPADATTSWPAFVDPWAEEAPPAARTPPSICGRTDPRYRCDPVTNQGCDGVAGEACDDDEHEGFGCYPPPNDVGEAGSCDDDDGPSCRGGLGCDTGDDDDSEGVCRRYCCANADCAGKRCATIDPKQGALGFCR